MVSAVVGWAVVIIVPENGAVPVEQSEIPAGAAAAEWAGGLDAPGF